MEIRAVRLPGLILVILAALLLPSCSGSNGSLTLNGIVADDPLVGATVTIYGPNSEILDSVTTDDAGEYRTSVPPGLAFRVAVDGGTIAGVPFTGTMESICDGTATCHVTPLTTLAAVLVDVYGLSLSQAQTEVSRTCGVNSEEDPFVLDQQGAADESDLIKLACMRERLGNAAQDIDAWLSETLETVPLPYDGTVKGTAESSGFLSGAVVNVIDNNGRIYEAATDDAGNWETSGSMIINSAFRVEAEGGSAFSSEFDGTLSAWVPYDEGINLAETAVRVSILSTLVDRYMQHTGRTHDNAVQAVKTYLSIPEDVSLNDDFVYASFSPFLFMEKSEENGGFDAFVDELVLKIDSGERICMGGAANADEIQEVPFAGKVLDGFAGGLGKSAGGFVFDLGVTLLGPYVGYQKPEEITAERFREMQNTLASMNTKLSGLENQLTSLAASLDIATDEIISHVYAASANSAAARINAEFTEYTALAGPDALATFFADMVNSGKELKNDLTEINVQLFEPAIGTGSGLEYLISSLEGKLRTAAFGNKKNRVLYDAYKTLETIFTQAMATQAQGALLLKSKFDYEDGGDLTRSDSFLNGTMRPRFERQTEKFLIFVERLVAAGADVRTMVQGGGAMFPTCTREIFHDADLLARQFIEDHDIGFILHVAGDPKSIAGCYGSPTGRDWGSPTFIPVNGQNVREYAAPLPDNASYYLGWTLDKNKRWHFSRETRIRFAKIKFAEIESRLSPPRTITYSFPYNQVAQVAFEQIQPAGIPYAHCFVTARAIPAFNFRNEDRVNAVGETFVPYEHKADRQSATLTARYGRGQKISWYKHFSSSQQAYIIHPVDVDTQADIYLEIINDSVSSNLRLTGAVEEYVTNDTGGRTPKTEQNLYWQVKVGGGTMFSRKYEYSVSSLPWNHLCTKHHETYPFENGGTARWEEGGTLDKMRQVYFRVSSAKTWMSHSDDLQHVDTVFKTTLKRFEIKPAD